MKGNDYNEQSGEFLSDETTGGDDISMPLGVDDSSTEGFDEFGSEDPSAGSKINSSALLLVVVVLVAAVGLFAMRTLTSASAAAEPPSELEQSIQSFLDVVSGNRGVEDIAKPLGKEEQAVLEILTESYASRQVPLENVQRNPFIIFENRPTKAAPEKQPERDPIEAQRTQRQELFERAAGTFRLRTVLMGSNPLANINNNIVSVGDTVTSNRDGVEFRVQSIESDYVKLVAEDRELGVRVETTIYIERVR